MTLLQQVRQCRASVVLGLDQSIQTRQCSVDLILLVVDEEARRHFLRIPLFHFIHSVVTGYWIPRVFHT
jgi:hypothetical protein